MAILVLGGAGYIGSHTVLALLQAGHKVVAADNLTTGYRAALPPQVPFYQLDVRNRAALDKLFDVEQIEGVIHFAALSLVGESMQQPLSYYDNNLHGTMVLLQAMQAHNIHNIVFSSSAAVYGEPENVPILETDSANPTNCYGETKLAIEKLLFWTSQASNLRYVALRYFNACGAQPGGQIGEAHQPETHLIPLILQVPLGQRQKLAIYGDDYPTPDGTCIRDYVHVCDLAQAHILALNYLMQGKQSDVFNLGSGQGFSVHQVLDCARQVTGHPIPAEIAPRRPGDPARLVASSAKAIQQLGWQPQFSQLADIIETAWQWHCSHPNGYAEHS